MNNVRSLFLTATAIAVCSGCFPARAAWWKTENKAKKTPTTLLTEKEDEWAIVTGARDGGTVTNGKQNLSFVTAKAGPPLVMTSKAPLTGDYEFQATVRVRTDQFAYGIAGFGFGKKAEGNPSVVIKLQGHVSNDIISCSVENGEGKPLDDPKAMAANLNWTPQIWPSYNYQPKAYSQFLPGWPEEFRASVEDAMSRLPSRDDRFVRVRAVLKKGSVQVWIDDRLITDRREATLDPAGTARIELYTGTQLVSYRIQTSTEGPPAGFTAVPLGGYANGCVFTAGAAISQATLPPPGETVTIKGIPFVFPGINDEGNDHLDISKSLFRQGNTADFIGANGYRWNGSSLRDPSRIQLRFANAQYDALYLVAAADGAKDSLPLVTAQFFRPSAGFTENFEANIPLATATKSTATPLGVTLDNGKKINLWLVKIALDPGKLSSLADLGIVEMELTKKVHLFRTWPDPYSYDYHAGGLPSGVHVYAVTLGKVAVGFQFEPDRFGHVWTAPEVPAYNATITNATGKEQKGTLIIATKSYDGTESIKLTKPVVVAARASAKVSFSLPVKLNGYHDITATLAIAGKTWTEKRSFVRLAPDTRSAKWEDGKGALFGYWSFHGGHHTPKGELVRDIMTKAGARSSIHGTVPDADEPAMKHWAAMPSGAWSVAPQGWAAQEPIDPEKRAAFKAQVIKNYMEEWGKAPEELRPDFVAFFPEPNISLRLTNGNFPSYWGEPDYQWSDYEKERIKMFRVSAEIAAEAVHEKWPNLKILIPWGDPLFTVPLLRDGISKNVIAGTAIDIPAFERMPEMQLHQLTPNRLYVLKKEYEKAGIPDPTLHYVEGIVAPTHEAALTWREQMDIYNRWTLLSMAYGVKRFYAGWNAYDLGSYYGAEHYGNVGIQRRIPYCDPKPAYAAFATMTDKLNQANYDGWLPTGSLTTYCLRFKGPKGLVYALWTLRGKRPVTLALKGGTTATVTDVMNNAKALKGGTVTITTDPSVTYITDAEIENVSVGTPDNSDAAVTPGAVQIGDLGDGTWQFNAERDTDYEESNFGIRRYQGNFSSQIINDAVHGKVFQSTLEKQEKEHQLMPWYRNLAPAKPIALKGAPSHLGIWVHGHSDWGRVVYTVHDADGERWVGVGQKDDWNNDDTHSWCSFNYDGWRYLRFELPGHLGYDNYRKAGTTWWGTYGGGSTAGRGIIDLPLTLDNIKIEQRSHVIYVNDVQPVASNTVELGKLYVEYDSSEDATDEAIRQSRLRMPLPPAPANLPNPIANLEKNGVGPATRITKLAPPEHEYDGTRALAYFDEVPGAKTYYIWVSAHEDGRSAVNLTPSGIKNGGLFYGLRPGIPLYYWVVYTDADGKMSKPSPVHQEVLVDAFAQK